MRPGRSRLISPAIHYGSGATRNTRRGLRYSSGKYQNGHGLDVLAAINVDGIGVKAPTMPVRWRNVTRFVAPEGERLADLMADLNAEFHLGLAQSKHRSERPGDDDGSFINAGFPWAVCNTGSIPYGDPNYHTEGDTYDKVDYANAVVAARLTLAAVLRLDAVGRP